MKEAHSFWCRGLNLILPLICSLLITNAYADDEDIMNYMPAILSAGQTSSPPPPPTIDFAGTWTINETAVSADPSCSGYVTFPVTVNEVSPGNYSVDFGHKTVTGSIVGEVLVITFVGTYPEDGGITTSDFSGTFSHDSAAGYSYTGREDWSWTDGSYSCAGYSTFTGTKNTT